MFNKITKNLVKVSKASKEMYHNSNIKDKVEDGIVKVKRTGSKFRKHLEIEEVKQEIEELQAEKKKLVESVKYLKSNRDPVYIQGAIDTANAKYHLAVQKIDRLENKLKQLKKEVK